MEIPYVKLYKLLVLTSIYIVSFSSIQLDLSGYNDCVKIFSVDALKEIISTLGGTSWEFDSDYCPIKILRSTPVPPKESERRIECDYCAENNTCHVVLM